MTRTILAAMAAVLLCPVGASAAGPPLSLDRANASAERHAGWAMAAWNEEAAEPPARIVGYERDACERESRRRASCDVTYKLSGGGPVPDSVKGNFASELCDAIITIRTTRRNRLDVRDGPLICD